MENLKPKTIEKIDKLLKLEGNEEYSILNIDGEEILYFVEPIRGGRSVLIEKDGNYLFWDSSISSGRRSGKFNI